MKQQSISTRLAALCEAVERRRMIQAEPVDELSKSLYQMGRELRQLGEKEMDNLYSGQDVLTREQFDRFVSDYSKF